jgi:dimethylaniline monooxygenase (N-oxide forming)
MHNATIEIDVLIIGGGLSGLLACKYIRAANLTCAVLESTDDIGGVWKYRDTPNGKGGVMLSTVSTSSKTGNEFSDFPMPDDYPPFQKHTLIMRYLNDYADHFQLRDSIRLNMEITEAVKDNDHWESKDNRGCTYRSRYLIVCSGVHQFPNRCYLEDERFRASTCESMHSSDFKRITDDFVDKDILIYGGGETASDIAIELTHVARSVTLSIPHGQWLFPVVTPVKVPTNADAAATMVADTFSSRLRRLVDPPFATFERVLDTKAHFTSQTFERWGGKCGHGIPEWENDAPYYGQFFNKNSYVIQLAHRGVVRPKGDVKSVAGNSVRFVDDSEFRFDRIVFCTGYKTQFPFLRGKACDTAINDLFKFTLFNDDPTLAFIGFARPLVGSFMGICELQSLYISKLFSGTVAAPDKAQRDKVIMEDKIFQALTFSATKNRIQGLVNFQSFLDELADLAGVRPDYWKLFLDSPIKWYYAVTAAHNNCQFLLHDKGYHDEIFRRYRRYHGGNFRVTAHVFALIVNMFPKVFGRRPGSMQKLKTTALLALEWFLILLLSPIFLFRIAFPIERRWKLTKRRMMQSGAATKLLERIQTNECT